MFSRQPEKVYRTELSPVAFLNRSAYVYPNKTAIIHGERCYTYLQFYERVTRLANRLAGMGVGKHDRVAFLCPNITALLEAHFAIPAIGGILVAINTRLNTEEIEYILQHSGARMLFVDRELSGLVENLQGPEMVIIDDSGLADDP